VGDDGFDQTVLKKKKTETRCGGSRTAPPFAREAGYADTKQLNGGRHNNSFHDFNSFNQINEKRSDMKEKKMSKMTEKKCPQFLLLILIKCHNCGHFFSTRNDLKLMNITFSKPHRTRGKIKPFWKTAEKKHSPTKSNVSPYRKTLLGRVWVRISTHEPR
jgi:hypothetical protein